MMETGLATLMGPAWAKVMESVWASASTRARVMATGLAELMGSGWAWAWVPLWRAATPLPTAGWWGLGTAPVPGSRPAVALEAAKTLRAADQQAAVERAPALASSPKRVMASGWASAPAGV